MLPAACRKYSDWKCPLRPLDVTVRCQAHKLPPWNPKTPNIKRSLSKVKEKFSCTRVFGLLLAQSSVLLCPPGLSYLPFCLTQLEPPCPPAGPNHEGISKRLRRRKSGHLSLPWCSPNPRFCEQTAASPVIFLSLVWILHHPLIFLNLSHNLS